MSSMNTLTLSSYSPRVWAYADAGPRSPEGHREGAWVTLLQGVPAIFPLGGEFQWVAGQRRPFGPAVLTLTRKGDIYGVGSVQVGNIT